jgi:pseudouridylate synthase
MRPTKKLIDDAIREALLDLKREGIKGKRVTPFLLEKINRITKGNFKLVTE